MSGPVAKFRRCVQVFGVPKALMAAVLIKVLPRIPIRGIVVPLPVPRSSKWVRGRTGTSDGSAYNEIFVAGAYPTTDVPVPSAVLDAGANVGYASVLFAEAWPRAQIIALEPDESNYRLLVRNCRPYSNIRPIRAALWGEKAALRIVNPGDQTTMIRVAATEGSPAFPTLMMRDIRTLAGVDAFDVAKIDIEGAELSLFTKDPGWLDHVGTLMIELHDDYSPGASAAFYAAVSGRTTRLYQCGPGPTVMADLSRDPDSRPVLPD
jgi:FkbM family methyltransferase